MVKAGKLVAFSLTATGVVVSGIYAYITLMNSYAVSMQLVNAQEYILCVCVRGGVSIFLTDDCSTL